MLAKYFPNYSLLSRFSQVAGFCTLLLATTPLFVSAKPAAQQPTSSTYERAKKELPKDLYVLYRIVDRLARANGLDERPWRVAVVPKYDINAFSTDVNLVALYSGILDQVEGDASALACIVGHEMGHSIKRHIALSQSQRATLIAQYQKEAEDEVGREVRSATTEATATSVAGSVVGSVVGGIFGGIGSSALQGASNQRIQTAQKRVQEIVKKKQEDLDKKIAETARQQEFEADETGYTYSVRAGFEPDGCMRAMDVLARTPGAEFDTDHPSVPRRIAALKELSVKYPPTSLAGEGKQKLSKTKPLTYDLSRDGVSLRINSRFGSSSNTDIDRLFGQ
ncbi:M48 family metallopeptidase [Kovacikia minuta CCNUW1]|uniref:M48 family metallopeptidase n=1 Tax=Kovacikia minuta TaxID=2931930 RepID=UPI001CC949F6|nr:M48 family metallopeptidase [Kovacikia minuta]UBF27513.1 M48 family metallopeptidase [Kovacikia minuta CCNUW1]